MSHPVLDALRSPDPASRREACRAAGRDPAGALLVDALLEALEDPAPSVARAAADALVELGVRERGLARRLRPLVRTGPAGRRFRAASALARLEPPDPGLLPVFVEALASSDGDVRWTATRLLVNMGRAHPEVLALFLGLVRSDERASVRRMATFALRELAPDLPESAVALLEASRDESLPVRRAAFTALAALLDPSRQVVARLVEALHGDPDPVSRRVAALSLAELALADPESVEGDALEALRLAGGEAEDPELRRTAREAWRRVQERAGR